MTTGSASIKSFQGLRAQNVGSERRLSKPLSVLFKK